MGRWALLSILALAVALAVGALFAGPTVRSSSPPPRGARAAPPAPKPQQRKGSLSRSAPTPPALASLGAGQVLRYVAIGGGAFPESNEVSLEQNLELAERILQGPGRLAFAGGAGAQGVRLQTDDGQPNDLLVRIGDIFAPRPGRRSRYRTTHLQARPADRSSVEAMLREALASGSEPLLVYVTTHGDQGERPRDNSVTLWGGEGLTAEQLAKLHAAHPRPMVAVIASCFSGGFAELAFEGADDHAGPTSAERCGLFAGTWDRETSGCDPDPDRARQEGYSLHFLHALTGRDRDGRKLAAADIDHDRDGRVSLLEAHSWATMTGRSFDVPTTTAERYLRSVQRRRGRANRALLPEHAAVVDRLSAALGIAGEAQAVVRLGQLDLQIDQLDAQLDRADEESAVAYRALAGRLLARWPVLDDPYHPEFGMVLAADRGAIEQALDTWPEALRLERTEADVERLEQAREPLEIDAAVVLRLVRAHETLALAGGLEAHGGARFAHLRRLLACERFVPMLNEATGRATLR